MPLDEFLPEFDVNEVHSTRVAAPPAETLAAARALTPREVPLTGVLMALRRLPAAIRARSGASRGSAEPRRSGARDAPILGQMTRGGFVLLAERADEIVLGVAGRFWTADGGILSLTRDEFVAFDEPGFAKAVVNFHVSEVSGGSVLTTETRITGTDNEARNKFRRYWRLVMPGSALIRRAWLRAIRRRAERAREAEPRA